MNDADLSAAFPSMATSDTPRSEPDPSPPADEQAILRAAFPSMHAEEPPAPKREAPRATLFPSMEDPPAAPRDTPPPTETRTAAPPEPVVTDPVASEPTDIVLESAGVRIALPAGHAADVAALEALDGIASDLRLTSAGTQRLVDLHAQSLERAAAAAEAQVTADWKRTTDGWREQARTDPEIGGDNFDASVKLARQVLDTYGPGLKQALRALGLTNHPEIVRLLVRVGRALPGSPRQSHPEEASRFFPSMK